MTSKTYAILYYGEWYLCRSVDSSAYGSDQPPGKIWSELRTTGYICKVGQEEMAIKLPVENKSMTPGAAA